jgi:hypothetical protein
MHVARVVALAAIFGLLGGPAAVAGDKTPTSMGFNRITLVTGSNGQPRQAAYTGLYAGGDVLQGETIIVKYRKLSGGAWTVLATKRPTMDDQNQTVSKFAGVPTSGWCSLVAKYPGDATHASTKAGTGRYQCASGEL